MKQKIVIYVHMRCDKCRKKALGIAASAHGVQSMGIEGGEKNQLVVVGDGVDAINLTSCLRRKVGSAEIVAVGAVDGAEKKKKPGVEDEASAVVWAPQQWCPPGYCYSRPATVCYEDGSPGCTIM